MNPRQRFLESLLFGTPDRVFFDPGYPRESTLAQWHQQGLPEGSLWHEHLLDTIGLPREAIRPPIEMDVSFRMLPAFEERVLEHRDGHYIVQDWMGAITEISDCYDYTYLRAPKDFVTRRWHAFPVRDRRDWEERIRWRYDPSTPERYAAQLTAPEQEVATRDRPMTIIVSGPFWQLREWCGLEGLCLLLVDEPAFVEEMIHFWGDFVHRVLERVVEHVVPDQMIISEDMAYKHHSMISPAMARDFLWPVWRRWASWLKAAGCPVVAIDSDGYVAELLPLWIQAGANCSLPMEVAAGNDIVAYRNRYGRQMAFQGGIDKRALAAGGDVMRREVLRVVPPLLRDGGFIPGCDHGVPPDVSWPNFLDYARLLAEVTGWL